MTETPLWTLEYSKVVGALLPLLKDTEWWNRREDVLWYVDKCIYAGVATTEDQMRLCALRYMAGKRKVSAPGSLKKKKALKRQQQLLQNVPKELQEVINRAMQSPMGAQYLGGNQKALNALMGLVLSKYKTDPSTVRLLICQWA